MSLFLILLSWLTIPHRSLFDTPQCPFSTALVAYSVVSLSTGTAYRPCGQTVGLWSNLNQSCTDGHLFFHNQSAAFDASVIHIPWPSLTGRCEHIIRSKRLRKSTELGRHYL